MTPLMPRSTAVWLIDHTMLTFEQIAEFCGMHMLEIQAIADDAVGKIAPFDPIAHGQLAKDEIQRCEQDAGAKLTMRISDVELLRQQHPASPKLKRLDRPNSILWVLKQHPGLSDKQISDLLHTTKSTVEAIRKKTYKNYNALKPDSPVKIGICSQIDLDNLTIHKTSDA